MCIALLVGALIWVFERRENEHSAVVHCAAWSPALVVCRCNERRVGRRNMDHGRPQVARAALLNGRFVVTIAVIIAGVMMG